MSRYMTISWKTWRQQTSFKKYQNIKFNDAMTRHKDILILKAWNAWQKFHTHKVARKAMLRKLLRDK